MFKKTCIIAVTLILATAAHSRPASERDYHDMANFRADLQSCFDSQMASPKFFADSDRAVDVVLTMVTFNRDRLNAMTHAAWLKSNAYPEMCRDMEVRGYKLQSIAGQGLANQAASRAELNQAVQNLQNAFPKPVWCNRIGTMTTCN